jgi:hypothetical protein
MSEHPQFPMVETATQLIEMRTADRHRILQRCFVSPGNASAPEPWQCIAYNISATGVAVALPVELPKDTVLTLEPWDLPKARFLRARVVHAKLVQMLWFTGCELVESLSEPELRVWCNGPLEWVNDPDPSRSQPFC